MLKFAGYGVYRGVYLSATATKARCAWEDGSVTNISLRALARAERRAREENVDASIVGGILRLVRARKRTNEEDTDGEEIDFDVAGGEGAGKPAEETAPLRVRHIRLKPGAPTNYNWRDGKWRYVFVESRIDPSLAPSVVAKIKELLKLRLLVQSRLVESENGLTCADWMPMLDELIEESEGDLKARLKAVKKPELYSAVKRSWGFQISLRAKAALEEILYGGRGEKENPTPVLPTYGALLTPNT